MRLISLEGMKALYLLSGLGADQRVFSYLDLSGYEVKYIIWITPLKDESISDYAKRLCDQIQSLKPILIGISFGGLMAVEIAKHIEVEKIIQISSVKTRTSLPLLYRFAGKIRLHKCVPASLFKSTSPLLYWFFGADRKEDKILLRSIMQDTDAKFLQWAIHQIANWSNEVTIVNLVQIHGSKDRLLPNRNADFTIRDGGHLMIVNKAAEINRILRSIV